MKISKKFMLTNLIINVVSMIMLALIISNIVTNYINQNITDDLINENESYKKIIYYGKYDYSYKDKLDKEKYYLEFEKEQYDAYEQIVFNKDKTINTKLSNELIDNIDIKIKNHILSQQNENIYTIKIKDKYYKGYNSIISIDKSEENIDFLVCTLYPDSLGIKIKSDIISTVIIAIIFISIIIIIATNCTNKIITKPMNKLVETTKKIASKDFDSKINLNTKDEFEVLANALNDMSDKLKKKDIQQKKFYEQISHELKTPVTVISGYAQGIKNNIFEGEDKYLDIIVNECENLKNELENIIYLSKLDTVNEFYNFKEESLNKLIEMSLDKVESIVIINEIDIEYNPKRDIIIKGDEDKIIRMFTNILSNCIKYTEDIIQIDTKLKDKFIEIQISDNGEGFDKNILKNPFSRGIIGKKGGSGIGLSIIKKIVDGHKGSIKLVNKNNGGAMYIIKLPLI